VSGATAPGEYPAGAGRVRVVASAWGPTGLDGIPFESLAGKVVGFLLVGVARGSLPGLPETPGARHSISGHL
jgi:hypothetical protein